MADTIERYTRNKQIELARSIRGKAKVYLDTRFWIIAREVAEGVRKSPRDVELLSLLRQGVASGALICPISESIFMEVTKQPNIQSRRIATAGLIDELSDGVTLLPLHQRLATEVAHFLHGSSAGVSLYPMSDLVWTKLSYVLGYVHPHTRNLSPADELRLQKMFVEKMWAISLSELFKLIGDSDSPEEPFAR